MDSDALVAARSETAPCGDDIFITGDNRFVRIVVVDSPGVGTGGKTTRVIGERLHGIDLIWPPDQILESLEPVQADGAAIMILRYDRLQHQLYCSGVGNISTYLGIDGRFLQPSLQPSLAGKRWPGFQNTVYDIDHSLAYVLHTDGLVPFFRPQIRSILAYLTESGVVQQENRRAALSFLLQLAFSGNRRKQDDAALLMGQWQR